MKNDLVTNILPSHGATVLRYTGSSGRLKVSMRHIDESKSTKWIPYFPFDKKELLKPGEIVPVEIPMLPIGMIFSKGEKLRLVVAGHNIIGGQMPNTPEVIPDNKGKYIIYTGGKYYSHLHLQVVKKGINKFKSKRSIGDEINQANRIGKELSQIEINF